MPIIEKISPHKMKIIPTDLEIEDYIKKHPETYLMALLMETPIKILASALLTYYQAGGQ